MSVGWFRSLFGGAGGEPPAVEGFYECSNCEAAFDQWPGPCPGCDQLVVRVVDRGGAGIG